MKVVLEKLRSISRVPKEFQYREKCNNIKKGISYNKKRVFL